MTALTAGLGAAALVLVALLPGAMFSWSFERWAGRFGIGLKDRALRFMGLSAVLLPMAAGPLYWVYANYWEALAAREPPTQVVLGSPDPLRLRAAGHG